MKYLTHSAEETISLGERIGKALQGGEIIAFRGDLGAGKTTLTRGIAIGVGAGDVVTSPTFALVNEYRGGRIPLMHFDMYRISDSIDLELTGFWDYLDEGAAIAVEWSENISDALPDGVITVTIKRVDENEREIEILGFGADSF